MKEVKKSFSCFVPSPSSTARLPGNVENRPVSAIPYIVPVTFFKKMVN